MTSRLQSECDCLLSIIFSVLVLMSIIHGQSWAKGEHIQGDRLPNLYDTLRVMKHEQGIDQALLYLSSLSFDELRIMKSESLFQSLEKVACLHSSPISSKQMQRALTSIQLMAQMNEVRPCLKSYLSHQVTHKKWSGLERHTILARAVALAARQTGRIDLLMNATQHFDPEVREHAANAGADPKRLCALLKDPWGNVKHGAIRGLEKIGGPEGLCLIEALTFLPNRLLARAIQTLGRLGKSSWAKEHRISPLLSKTLTTLVYSKQAHSSIKRSALVALANWGSLSEARDILESHLKTGRLESLTLGALQAIVVGSPDTAFFSLSNIVIKSPSVRVRLAAIRFILGMKKVNEAEQLELNQKKYALFKDLVESPDLSHHPLFIDRLKHAIMVVQSILNDRHNYLNSPRDMIKLEHSE